MNIAFLTTSVSREGGGLYDAVRRIALESTTLHGSRIQVFGLEDASTRSDMDTWQGLPLTAARVRGPRAFGYAPQLAPCLDDAKPDLVHQHGIWMYPSLVCRRWAAETRRPYIVSAHGMLEPWAIRYHFWKKIPAWLLWERVHIKSATLLHATSEQEAGNLRRLGLTNSIAVIPNGVDIPDTTTSNRTPDQERRAVFLSRIHPKKGLLNLVEAWRRVRPRGWRLVIAGPDECNHLSTVQAAVREARLTHEITFVGSVYDEEKLKLLSSASLFILPTFSENFGIVVAEALASAVPVITTRSAPWGCLETQGCGWWIDTGAKPLVHALYDATQRTDDERWQMGLRGRQFVSREYSWTRVAADFAALYEWCAGGGPRPECVLQ